MRCFYRFAIALIFDAAIAAAAVAGPFSSLVIFGDSLSDVGNISQASFGVYPGKYYYQNRFSNGPVYAEALSVGLGLAPMTSSLAGGNDFAYGGAQTSGTGGLDGIFIKDVDEQVSQFLSTRSVDPHALFEVFSGANDFINGQTNVNTPVNTIVAQIGRLVAVGAAQFFVPNLPLLGDTPRFNGNASTQSQYNTLTTQFNAALAAAIDNLPHRECRAHVLSPRRGESFEQAHHDPAAFGLTNVTAAAAPGLTPGTSSYDKNRIAPTPINICFGTISTRRRPFMRSLPSVPWTCWRLPATSTTMASSTPLTTPSGAMHSEKLGRFSPQMATEMEPSTTMTSRSGRPTLASLRGASERQFPSQSLPAG